MRIDGAPFLSGILLSGVLVRLSPDSALTQNTMANIIPSKKNRPYCVGSFHSLILSSARQRSLLLFYIETKPPLTLCDSVPAM
jgi:hypothetical protein